ncbi:MAG: type III pantothenate kinase [Clostridia bacterium]|nr:type III pantothenate kinase [Clostridia bacterium]
MILVLDIGNTNIKLGVFENDKLKGTWRISTDLRKTSDEYGIAVLEMLKTGNITPDDLEGVIMSSVVPGINFTIEHMLTDYIHKKPIMVGAGIKTGLNIRIDNPRETGGDIICDAVSAIKRYGGPVITIDFGTATTICATNEKSEFLGGCILAGVRVSSDALSERAANLPSVALDLPESILGKNTIQCMQAGLLYGYIGQIEYIIGKMKMEKGFENARVIATGGLAKTIAVHTKAIDVVDSRLTLEGLRLLYYMNKEGK